MTKDSSPEDSLRERIAKLPSDPIRTHGFILAAVLTGSELDAIEAIAKAHSLQEVMKRDAQWGKAIRDTNVHSNGYIDIECIKADMEDVWWK